MYINRELADKYQEFFSFMSQEHNLILTVSEMDEILSEAKKLESKLSQHDVSGEFTAFRKLVKRRIGSEIFKEIEEEVKAVNLR
jgi:flagellar biosynthesis regulator FlbT